MPIVTATDRSFDVDVVVFDKDGTLVDLDAFWFPVGAAWIEAVAQRDPELSGALARRLGVDLAARRLVPDSILAAGTFEHVRGATTDELLERSWQHVHVHAALRRAERALDHALRSAQPAVLADVVGLFGTLATAGLRIAVLTSDDREPTLDFLRELGADHLVDVVVTATDVEHPKPHPNGLHLIAAELAVDADRMLMIGDSSFDRQAARAAGTWFVAVGRGSEAAAGADASVACVDELVVGAGRLDTLNDIGVLKRREIEARIVAPLVQRLAERYGDGVFDVAREVIVDVARGQGAELATLLGDDSLPAFARGLGAWSADGALESTVVELTETSFAFDVTRCRYAEMYLALGLEELGATLSCDRDAALVEGFNPQVTFTRTQTIMGGATHCDFRYELRDTPVQISR